MTSLCAVTVNVISANCDNNNQLQLPSQVDHKKVTSSAGREALKKQSRKIAKAFASNGPRRKEHFKWSALHLFSSLDEMLKGLQLQRTGHRTRAEDELTYAQRTRARKTLPRALGKLCARKRRVHTQGKKSRLKCKREKLFFENNNTNNNWNKKLMNVF